MANLVTLPLGRLIKCWTDQMPDCVQIADNPFQGLDKCIVTMSAKFVGARKIHSSVFITSLEIHRCLGPWVRVRQRGKDH